MSDSPELQTLLDSLMHPELKVIDLSLNRMQRYLDAYGNPEKRIPPVVHVAGTNGKGSTIAFLRAMLESAGYRVHVYTSPHLVHFRERIVLAGEEVSDDELIPFLTTIKERTADYPLTFFEATTAAAFELFAKHDADITLLEVGMGGRYDATNVVDKQILSVITSISMDHMEYLGDTIEKIAAEKAAIMKERVAVISSEQLPKAMAAIEFQAELCSVPVAVSKAPDHIDGLGLYGEYQRINAQLAIDCARFLGRSVGGYHITEEHIHQGLASAYWPGRLQRLNVGKLVELLPDGMELWLDGGHNEAAGQAIGQWISEQEQPVHVICAMVAGKDHEAYLANIVQKSASLGLTIIPDEPLSASLEALEQAASAVSADFTSYNDPKEAICAQKSQEGLVLCCGSLYFVGALLEENT